MTTRFLMIARVLYDKGYNEYVEAAKIIHEKYHNVEFMLLGAIDNEYPNAVPKEKIYQDAEKGFIDYLGYKKDVRSIIEQSDCIVLPSFYNEGLSRVLMEGLAMRKPIITTDIPGCRETVDDGINGFICKPRDINSLVLCLTKFIKLNESERKQMGEKGREKAEKQFDIKFVKNIYDTITSPYKII